MMSLAAVPTQPLSTKQEIQDFISGFVTLWNKADLQMLATSFTPNASLQTPSGHASSRGEIKTFLKQQEVELFNGRRMSIQIRTIRLDSSQDAKVDMEFLLDGYSAMGFGSLPPGTLSFVLHKDKGRWLIQQAVMQR